jgi:hypothetical protein
LSSDGFFVVEVACLLIVSELFMNTMNTDILFLLNMMAWFVLPSVALVGWLIFWYRKAPVYTRLWQTTLLVGVCSVFFVWLQWFHNPLPTDEIMIKNFHEHRAAFEQLVQGQRNYRGDTSKPPYSYSKTPEAQSLLRQVGMSDISVGSILWYPDAYSERIAWLDGKFYGHSPEGIRRTPEERVDYWKKNLPEMFEGVAPVSTPLQLDYLRGQLHIRWPGPPDAHAGSGVVYRLRQFPQGIDKSYAYFPYPPRVELGQMIYPGYDMQDRPETGLGIRVFDSLNDYPPDWKDGECVGRKIEPQWFIYMCKDW